MPSDFGPSGLVLQPGLRCYGPLDLRIASALGLIEEREGDNLPPIRPNGIHGVALAFRALGADTH